MQQDDRARLEAAVRDRIADARPQIETSIRNIEAGVPRASEPELSRLAGRYAHLGWQDPERLASIVKAAGVALSQPSPSAELKAVAEKLHESDDFLSTSFLRVGAAVSRAVARVAYRDRTGEGTGFMISDRLFMTNNHVLQSAERCRQFQIEFNYERDFGDTVLPVTAFALDPETFFLTDPTEDLDFTIVAVGERLSGSAELAGFGWLNLLDNDVKHALGEPLNIIQHPAGRPKVIAIHNNRRIQNVVSRDDRYLHYRTDTLGGSSGSPVFNNQWEVVALHHFGFDDPSGGVGAASNEGVRISRIVRRIRDRQAGLGPSQRSLIADALAGVRFDPEALQAASPGPSRVIAGADGEIAVWRIPIEVAVRLGSAISGSGAAPLQPLPRALDVDEVLRPRSPAAEVPAPESVRAPRRGGRGRRSGDGNGTGGDGG